MTHRASAIVLGVCAAARILAGLVLGFRPFDDTYITFRYSLNLASGHGFVYNLGEPVLGTTTPLWTLVLAVFAALGAPIEQTALVVSLACDAASAFLLFRLLTTLEFGGGIPLAGACLFLGIFDGLSLARSGMESSFFVCLVLGALAFLAERRLIAAGVFAALAALTRPEGALVVVLFPAALWHYRRDVHRRHRAIAAAALAAIGGVWALYATVTFGSVIPQSVRAKSAAFADPALAAFSWSNVRLFFVTGQYGGEIYSRTYLQLAFIISLLAGLGAAWLLMSVIRGRSPDAVPRVALLMFFPAAYLAGMSLSHAFTFFPWYYAPMYPFLAALAPIGAGAITRWNSIRVSGMTAVLIAAQLAAAAAVKLPADKSDWIAGYFDVSRGVPRETGVSVAAPEIGSVGWRVWPAKILDLEGLVTPDAVGVKPQALLKLTRPDYLVVRTDNAAGLLSALQQDEWFARTYEMEAMRPDAYSDREFRLYKKRGEE